MVRRLDAVIVAAWLTLAASAQADPKKTTTPAPHKPEAPVVAPAPTEDLGAERDRLRFVLEAVSADSAKYRVFDGVMWLVLGGTLTGTGVFMWTQPSGGDWPAVSATVTGALVVGAGAGILALNHTDDPFQSIKSTTVYGAPSDTRAAWKDAAAGERSSRHWVGAIELGVASLVILGGVLTATTVPPFPGATQYETHEDAVGVLSVGALLTFDGLRRFISPGPIEASWKTYEAMTSPASGAPQVSLGLVPAAGGGAAGLVGRF